MRFGNTPHDTPGQITSVTETPGLDGRMARNRVASGGRPSKGPRHAFLSRVPMDAATRLMEEADELDVSYSELIAHVIGERYGLHVPMKSGSDRGQKELALQDTA